MSDIPFAVSLTDIEGWGFYPEDFRTRLQLYPSSSFVARLGKTPVGIISSVHYDKFAFLGNLIVLNRHRGHGIGASLMRHAISHVCVMGATTIELDGVLEAVSLYRRLGFRDKYLSVRFARPASERTLDPIKHPVRIRQILDLDRKLTGVARHRLLRSALLNKRHSLITVDNPATAYALIRQRAGGFCMIAPLVASSWKPVPRLIADIVAQYGDHPLWVGVPEQHYRMSQLLVSNGFEYRAPSLRMYFGRRLEYEKHVYGIFGPAVG